MDGLETYILRYNLTANSNGEPITTMFNTSVTVLLDLLEQMNYIVDFDTVLITTERELGDLILVLEVDVFNPYLDLGDE